MVLPIIYMQQAPGNLTLYEIKFQNFAGMIILTCIRNWYFKIGGLSKYDLNADSLTKNR